MLPTLYSTLQYIGIFSITWLVFVKLYCKCTIGFYKGRERLQGKTVVVTGASAGIGLESAKALAKLGARILMLCRDVTKAEVLKNQIIRETGNSNVVVKYIDFSSLSSVRSCALEILSEESHIHVLLNNAGACALGLGNITADGLEKVMQTNHFGPFLFTNILLGRIKESKPSRIVNVSSVMHYFARLDLNRMDQKHISSEIIIYSNSKLANIYFTTELAKKLKDTGVTVNCLHPGVVRSDMNRNMNKCMQFIWDTTMKTLFKTTWEGAQTSIYLCASDQVSGVTGKYFSDCRECGTSREARDPIRAARLWEISEEAVQLKDHERHY